VVNLETASRDAKPLNLSPNVSKFYAWQVGSWMNEQQSQNLLLKVDPLSIIHKNKLNTQGEKIETAKFRVFVFVFRRLKNAAQDTCIHCVLLCTLCGILIKNHQNNLLFSYYKLRCRSFELNLFSHCFNLKDLNLTSIPNAWGRTYWLLCNLLIWPNVLNVCCLRFEIR